MRWNKLPNDGNVCSVHRHRRIMDSRIIRFSAMAVLVLIVSACAVPQEAVIRERTSGSIVFFEAHSVKRDTQYHVFLPVKIRHDFFVFIRPLANPSGDFTAVGEISIELVDSTGTSVARDIHDLRLTTTDNSPSILRSQYLQNLFAFDLYRGTYTVVVRIEDKESKRVFADRKQTISVPSATVPELVPVQQYDGSRWSLFNLSGNVRFSEPYGFVFLSPQTYTRGTYSLVKLRQEDDQRETIISDQPVTIQPMTGSSYTAAEKDNTIWLSSETASGSTLHYISFEGRALRQGRYELRLTFPDSSKTQLTFGALWLDMPSSLTDLDAATEPLQYIMTRSDYSELRSGGRGSRILRFEEFWRTKDATPETAYNEVMHEFYRRVDYAASAFRTLRGVNGAMTDRGKIYILHGKPNTIQRILDPNGAPKEIWSYASQNLIFTFEDPSKQGNYKLAENK